MNIIYRLRTDFAFLVLAVSLVDHSAYAQDMHSANEPAFCNGWREYRDGEFFDDYNKILNSGETRWIAFTDATEDAQRILDEMDKFGDDGLYSANFLGSDLGEVWLQSVNFVKLTADGIYDTLSVVFSAGALTSIKLTAEEAVLKQVASGAKMAESFANSHAAIAAAKITVSLQGPVGATIVAAYDAYENAERFETTNDGIKEMRSILNSNTRMMMGHISQAEKQYSSRVARLDSLNDTKIAFDKLCGGSMDEEVSDLFEDFETGTPNVAETQNSRDLVVDGSVVMDTPYTRSDNTSRIQEIYSAPAQQPGVFGQSSVGTIQQPTVSDDQRIQQESQSKVNQTPPPNRVGASSHNCGQYVTPINYRCDTSVQGSNKFQECMAEENRAILEQQRLRVACFAKFNSQ